MNCVAMMTYDSGCRGNWSRMIFPTDQQFLIQITSAPPKAKIASGPARLHIQDQRFCITTGVPPRLIGFWEIGQLRWVSAAGLWFLWSSGIHWKIYVSWGFRNGMKVWTDWVRNYGVSFVCGLWTYFGIKTFKYWISEERLRVVLIG